VLLPVAQIMPNSPSVFNTTMSSREIAELTGKEHKNVLADIRKMLEELDLASADFSGDLIDLLTCE
jgi:phage regulator Rha-like protein